MLNPEPTSLADPADIAAFVAEDQRRFLTGFYTAVQDVPLDALIAAIRQTCGRGFGFWCDPTPVTRGRDLIRPTTHLYEIALFGVIGVGFDVNEAARSWRRAAANLLGDVA